MSASDYSNSSYTKNPDIYHRGDFIKNYVLIDKLGSGSFASVWLTYDYINDLFFAIKIQNDEDYDCAIDEIKFLKKVSRSNSKYINHLKSFFIHKKIVDDQEYKNVCMIFDLMAGSLHDLITNSKYSKGFPLLTVKKIIYQLLIALKSLNDHNIVHTDLKTDNILLVGHTFKINDLILKFKNLMKNNKFKFNKKNIKKNITQTKKIFSNIINDLHFSCSDSSDSSIDSDCSDSSNSSYYSTHSYNKFDDLSSIDSSNSSNSLNSHISDYSDSIDPSFIHHDSIHIKLSDFGSCLDVNNLNFDIQTRYYRAPEIILHSHVDSNSDLWSIGCIIYELLTGKLLFDPIKNTKFSDDILHLYDIISIFGFPPNDLLVNSSKFDLFFRSNSLLKINKTINFSSLSLLLKNNLHNDLNDHDFYLTLDFMYDFFNYDSSKRPSIESCLNHPWFDDLNI